MEKHYIGIDFGSKHIRVAACHDERYADILHVDTGRYMRNAIYFGDEGRLFGDAAYSEKSFSPDRTITCLKELLSVSHCKSAEKSSASKIDKTLELHENSSEVIITINNKKRAISFSTLLAMILEHLVKDVEQQIGAVAGYAISIPKTISTSSFYFASKSSKLSNFHVIRDSFAAATVYSRRAQQANGVLIIGIGARHSHFAFFDVVDGSPEIMQDSNFDDFAGDDIDSQLADHFCREVTFPEDPPLRLLKACEKLKIDLSAGASARIEVEAFPDDCVFKRTITREQFLTICSEIFDRFQASLRRLVETLRVTREIKEVVLIGGTVAIPRIREIVEKEVAPAPLTRVLDIKESTAQGAAIAALKLGDDRPVDKYCSEAEIEKTRKVMQFFNKLDNEKFERDNCRNVVEDRLQELLRRKEMIQTQCNAQWRQVEEYVAAVNSGEMNTYSIFQLKAIAEELKRISEEIDRQQKKKRLAFEPNAQVPPVKRSKTEVEKEISQISPNSLHSDISVIDPADLHQDNLSLQSNSSFEEFDQKSLDAAKDEDTTETSKSQKIGENLKNDPKYSGSSRTGLEIENKLKGDNELHLRGQAVTCRQSMKASSSRQQVAIPIDVSTIRNAAESYPEMQSSEESMRTPTIHSTTFNTTPSTMEYHTANHGIQPEAHSLNYRNRLNDVQRCTVTPVSDTVTRVIDTVTQSPIDDGAQSLNPTRAHEPEYAVPHKEPHYATPYTLRQEEHEEEFNGYGRSNSGQRMTTTRSFGSNPEVWGISLVPYKDPQALREGEANTQTVQTGWPVFHSDRVSDEFSSNFHPRRPPPSSTPRYDTVAPSLCQAQHLESVTYESLDHPQHRPQPNQPEQTIYTSIPSPEGSMVPPPLPKGPIPYGAQQLQLIPQSVAYDQVAGTLDGLSRLTSGTSHHYRNPNGGRSEVDQNHAYERPDRPQMLARTSQPLHTAIDMEVPLPTVRRSLGPASGRAMGRAMRSVPEDLGNIETGEAREKEKKNKNEKWYHSLLCWKSSP